MKHLPTASKTIAMLLCATLLVACSGNDTNDAEEEARLKAEQEAAKAREEAEKWARRREKAEEGMRKEGTQGQRRRGRE